MINLEAATSSALSTAQLKGATFLNSLPMVPQMAVREIQNIGTYDLVHPFLHFDYPTRNEVDLLIRQSFIIHDSTNMHFGSGSRPGNTIPPPVMLIPKESIIGESKVRAGSPVNQIGYSL